MTNEEKEYLEQLASGFSALSRMLRNAARASAVAAVEYGDAVTKQAETLAIANNAESIASGETDPSKLDSMG